MNVHYKIVEVWPQDHLIVVRFWTDNISEEFLASNSNRREDGTPVRCRSDVSLTLSVPPPTGQQLEDFMLTHAPMEWLKTLENVLDPEVDTSMSEILKLTNQTFIKNEREIDKIKSGMTLSDIELEDLIKSVSEQKSAEG